MLSLEYWSALCPLTPIFRKLHLNFKIHLQFKCDSEPNIFGNIKLATKVSLWKYVDIMQHNTENEKSASSHFHTKVGIENSNIRATIFHAQYSADSRECPVI
jgi:hypothetical protein